uniref:Uncharacterized protein n=1 Tax=Oryza barthii TaxID=65489 RepID=A0A0D3H581_9ORYZ
MGQAHTLFVLLSLPVHSSLPHYRWRWRRGAAARAVTAVRAELRWRRLPVPHVAATSSRLAAASSLLRARGQCGSLLHPRRLRFSVAPIAAAKPEAISKPPGPAPPSPRVHGAEPLICAMIFAGTSGEAAAAPVEELAKSLQGVELFDLRGKAVPLLICGRTGIFCPPPPSQQLRAATAAITALAAPCRSRQRS